LLLAVTQCSQFISNPDAVMVSWLSTVAISLGVLGALAMLGYGIYKKSVPHDKQFLFFICHHKAGAGAFARWLKYRLCHSLNSQGRVFVDSDNLDDLDLLFSYVGEDTKVLVVLCSPEIFTRPWCIGEMTTARLMKVPVVLV